jgi:uroporphyrin-III C-methyltransferase
VTGTVHLVGAGPGDPELLTLRARRLLDAADVVVHDRLISPALLDTIPPGVRLVAVGKAGGGFSTPQDQIHELLIGLARAGADVVRLKGGDPFVFGRGGEEALALLAAGVAFEVVPGVSAGFAGPAAAAIPVTHRGVARSVAFVTGETDPSAGGLPIDWAAIAAIDTVVVFMAGRSAKTVAERLIAGGRDPSTRAAVLVDATLPGQTVLWVDLETLRRRGAGQANSRPTLLVVGDVVGIGAALSAHITLPPPDPGPAEVAGRDSAAARSQAADADAVGAR